MLVPLIDLVGPLTDSFSLKCPSSYQIDPQRKTDPSGAPKWASYTRGEVNQYENN